LTGKTVSTELRPLIFLDTPNHREEKSQFIVLYGKRRVGKTSLVKEFPRTVPLVYFLADKVPEKNQLQPLSERVGFLYNDEFLFLKNYHPSAMS